MKKTSFFIAIMALCASLTAQTTSNQFYKKIGETYYNVFTNGTARNTIGFNPQTLNGAAVWTMGFYLSYYNNNRGTGINYYDANNNTWGAIPNPQTDRIETEYTGWGTHGFTEEGEIVVAHNSSTGLVVNTRDVAGEGTWQQQLLQGPNYILEGTPTTEILWPTMVTKGNTVHLVCVTAQWLNSSYPPDFEPNPDVYPQGYLGFSMLPLYYRSTDGGKTWEAPRDFRACGMTNFECFTVSSDQYQLAVRGNHIVLLYYDRLGFVNYMESKDGGDTWEKKTVYEFGMIFYQEGEIEPRLLPTTASICIDENHKVHVVFSAQCCKRDIDLPPSYYSYFGQLPVGMVYWNDDRQPIDWQDIRGWEQGGTLTNNWESYQGYIPLPSVVGLDKFYIWENAPQYDPNEFKNFGWALYPRLLAKDGRVYVSYQSPLDFAFDIYGYYYRGIFITVSEDYGETWDVQNNTSWISYNENLFLADWTYYTEPTYTPEGEPVSYPAEDVDLLVISENAFPSMSYNYKGDLFMLQWATDLFPFSYPPGYITAPLDVYTFTQDLKNIPAYKNIQEVCRGMWNGTDPFIVFPPQSCEKPEEMTATCNDDEDLIVLNWEKPEYISQTLLGYNVFRNGNKINASPITETHFEEPIPEPGSYKYQVSAVYSNCESKLTYGVTIVITALSCEKPVGLTGVADKTDAILTWNEPENMEGILLGYNIYRDETQINETLLVETEYIDKGLDSGTYAYQVSAVYEHCDESDLTDKVTVTIKTEAIHEVNADALKIYPNPTTGELIINNEQLIINSVEIFDVYGRKLSSNHLITSSSNHQINISDLSAGVYFVKISTESGIVTKKVIKY